METHRKSRWLKRSSIVRQLVNERDLPALPEIVLHLNELLMDPNVQASQVATLIETEPVITGRVMKLANSAYFAAGRKPANSVQMAIGRLGFDEVRNLVYSATLPDIFNRSFFFNHHRFWTHCFTVALLAREIAEQWGGKTEKTAEQAYLAGLLHDIGVLILVTLEPIEYSEVTSAGFNMGRLLPTIEEAAFGIDHAEVGALFLARHWEMDQPVVQAVRQHHTDFEACPTLPPVAGALYIANTVCNIYNITNGTLADYRYDHMSMLSMIADRGFDTKKLEHLLTLARDQVGIVNSILTN